MSSRLKNKNDVRLHRNGFLYILSAPSGAGKTTIYKALLEKNSSLTYSVSVTTRPIRQDEQDGRDYFLYGY
jgi:guanylate kinase